MLQFTSKEIEHLRKKAKREPYILQLLEGKTSQIFKEPVLVPEEGIANWYMHYFCPKCSIPLEFNKDDKYNHKCLECNNIYRGEPYDSSWWQFINTNNFKGSYHMGLLYILTEDLRYARKAIEILMAYSKYYIDYQIHGDIPYNGPGKAGAQTLDEAIFIRHLACAYDLVEDVMSEEEKKTIRDRLLIPGAEFLVEYRTKQIHNHEVIINAAIGIVGLLFDKEDLIQFSIYEPYGLLYQLEHGVLKNKMWFEGTFGYHFYALANFFAYEKFAVHTKHSHISNPIYKEMLELVLNYVYPNFTLPMMNDMYFGHGTLKGTYLFEFAYREIKSSKILAILTRIYEEQKRKNIEAFFYGVDYLEQEDVILSDYHTGIGYPGHTILRGKNERYLLIKHDTYGGEHDHYDRLAISYVSHGERISPDIGTTGYGALLHYDYYKNTGTHNTITIGEENQPPAQCQLTRHEKINGITYVEAKVDWGLPYEMPDSFTIKQWDDECYRNVRMTRKIAWADSYMVELFIVDGVDDKDIDWTMHFCGQRISQNPDIEKSCEKFTDKKPLKYLYDITMVEGDYNLNHVIKSKFKIGSASADLYSYATNKDIYFAMGPDNPSITDISYIIERINGKKAVFFHVLESYDHKPSIKDVNLLMEDGKAVALIQTSDGKEKIVFDYK